MKASESENVKTSNKKKTKKNEKKKEEEEEKYNKTKLSMLGRSVFEPTFQEMSKLRWEIVQNRETCGYYHCNINNKK